MNFIDVIKENIKPFIDVKETRPNLYQVVAPFYHEDGDMVEIFIENKNNHIMICDKGMTLMKLSYDIDIKNTNEKIFNQMLKENYLDIENGNIFIDSDVETLNSKFLQFAQTISKISGLKYFTAHRQRNIFYEILGEYVKETFINMQYTEKFVPLERYKDYVVDYMFNTKQKPIYLFAVKDDNKAKDVIIANQAFKLEKVPFKSVVVYQDYSSISKLTQERILRVTDKPFLDIEQFKEEGYQYIAEEVA